MRREVFVGFKLGGSYLYARRRNALRTFEPAFSYKALDLTRVGLILDAVLAPTDYSVKGAALLSIRRTRA